jgi:hypothetical protein
MVCLLPLFSPALLWTHTLRMVGWMIWIQKPTANRPIAVKRIPFLGAWL